MRYITPCETARLRVPPGSDHTQKFPEYRMQPGVAWRYDAGENTAVEIDRVQAARAVYAWRSRWVDGRTVEDFEIDGVTYSQPSTDDPRAKDRALGSTRKRSKFMASVQKARAEEAERQGKEPRGAKIPVAPLRKRVAELLPLD